MDSQPVLRLLAPLTPQYVQRVAPESALTHPSEAEHASDSRQETCEACVLEAVVTVDAKGRVPWPASAFRLGRQVASVTVLGERMVEVMLSDEPETSTWSLDARGRLQLPRGLLRAAGIHPGERLAIIRSDDPPRVILTSVANLAVRRAER